MNRKLLGSPSAKDDEKLRATRYQRMYQTKTGRLTKKHDARFGSESKLGRRGITWALDTQFGPRELGVFYVTTLTECLTSRVIAHRVDSELSMEHVACLLEEAVGRFGRPSVLRVDRAAELT